MISCESLTMATTESSSAGVGAGSEGIRVEVVRAWPRRFESIVLTLPPGATVREALARAEALDHDVGSLAVYGERVGLGYVLADGDRIELLRPLLADPKDARRRRAKG